MNKVYSGIGSRRTPPDVLDHMVSIASLMEEKGYVLHSGGAAGADSAFEKGVTDPAKKKIFLPWRGFNNNSSPLFEISESAIAIAKKHHPSWHLLSLPVKRLMARNVYQILGESLNVPVNLVICYTPYGRVTGGTGQTIRLAEQFGIPVFNLYFKDDIQGILLWVESGGISYTKKLEIESWKLM